jgi:hypothetical protein
MGHFFAQAIYVAAALGVYDVLGGEAKPYDDVAARVGAHPSSLRRVLRLLVSAGVYRETESGELASTPVRDLPRAGADAYPMKHVIHDWGDDRAAVILGNCRRAGHGPWRHFKRDLELAYLRLAYYADALVPGSVLPRGARRELRPRFNLCSVCTNT